jgi:hypothetical protein
MPASWVNTSFYEGDDIDADGNLWGLGASEDVDVRKKLDETLISVDKAFGRVKGIAGVTLRDALSKLRPLIQTAINMWKANLLSPKAKEARDAAYEVLYDLDQRPQLQSTQPVPDWLLEQVRDRIKKLIMASFNASIDLGIMGALFDVFGPMTPEKVGIVAAYAGRTVGEGGKALAKGFWGSVPLWVKIMGGVVVVGLGVAVYKLVRASIPRAGLYGVRRPRRRQRLLTAGSRRR